MRGDVYRLPARQGARGHEQQGGRYGVVMTSDVFAPLSTWVVIPTSTSSRPASFRPEVEVLGRRTMLLPEQVVAVDKTRLGELVGHLRFDELRAVEAALRLLLAL